MGLLGIYGCATPSNHGLEVTRVTTTQRIAGVQTGSLSEYTVETLADGPTIDEPFNVLTGEHQLGSVSTRVYDRRHVDDDRDGLFARQVTNAANAAVSLVWSDYELKADIGIYLLTGGEGITTRYRFSRENGGVWNLPLHMRRIHGPDEGALGRQVEIPIHELYHLLAIEQGIGLHGDNPPENPLLGLIWEETAARLFASCGLLQATGRATRSIIHSVELPSENGTSRVITAPLDDATLGEVLGLIENARRSDGSLISPEISNLLDLTLWSELSGGQYSIEAGTPQANALLDACRRVGPDPYEITPMLREALLE